MTTSPSYAEQSPRTGQVALVLAATLAICAATITLSTRHYQYNLSSLLFADVNQLRAGEALPGHHLVVYYSHGQDGAAYYRVALDPLLRHPTLHDPYRYQRIGYPALTWVLAYGNGSRYPAVMAAINVLAIVLGAVVIYLLLGSHVNSRDRPALAILAALTPATLIGLQHDLAEPLAIALALLGLLFYLRGRTAAAASALAFSVLTREVTITVVLPLIVAEVLGRRPRNAVMICLSLVPYAAWQAVLNHRFGRLGAQGSEQLLTPTLAGLRADIVNTIHAASGHRAGWISVDALMLFFVLAVAIAAMLVWRHRADVVAWLLLVNAGIALTPAPVVETGFINAGRIVGIVYPLVFLLYARYRSRSLFLLAGFIVLLSLFAFWYFSVATASLPYYLTP